MKVPKCAFNFIMHSYSVIFFPSVCWHNASAVIALCIRQIGISTVSNRKCTVKAGLCQVIAERERNKSQKNSGAQEDLGSIPNWGPEFFPGLIFLSLGNNLTQTTRYMLQLKYRLRMCTMGYINMVSRQI